MPCPGCGVDVRGYSACPGCGAALPVTDADDRKQRAGVSGPSLPDEPWKLTAPESYVLRYGLGDRIHALFGFKLALQELVARQALIVQGAWVRRRWAPGRYPTFLLCDGPRKAEVKERSLRTIVWAHTDLVERRPSHGVPFSDPEGAASGVLLERFVSDAARRDGGYKAYLEREVASSLRDRKLLSAVNARTPAGVRASEQLDAWMEVSERGLFKWSHDQTWLQAYLTGAGAAVFLAQFATPSQPVLKHIGTAVAASPSADWSLSAAAWDSGGLDFAGLADSLDGTMGAFDAGLLDVGGFGGGGGDGGGGG